MTGEMHRIDQNGRDSNGDEWSMHAAIAKALRAEGYDATLQPFDQYQGPYILVGKDVRVGSAPYQLAVQHQGVIRLWITILDQECYPNVYCVYREDTMSASESFWHNDIEGAIACAKELMQQEEE